MSDTPYLIKPHLLRWYMRGMWRRIENRPAPFPAAWFARADVAGEMQDDLPKAVAESEGWDYMDKLYRLTGVTA